MVETSRSRYGAGAAILRGLYKEAQVKSSPAMGHAAGHYKKAVDDLNKIKMQLHEGCRAWNGGAK